MASNRNGTEKKIAIQGSGCWKMKETLTFVLLNTNCNQWNVLCLTFPSHFGTLSEWVRTECLRLKSDPWPLPAKNRAHPWAQEEIPDTCTEIPLRQCHRKFQHQSKQAANRKTVKTTISVSKQKKIIHRTGNNSTLCHYCSQLVNMI